MKPSTLSMPSRGRLANLFRRSQTGLFASESLSGHLLRGALALSLLNWALGHPASPLLALICGVGALIAFRGCPICWTIGLLETIKQKLRNLQQENKPMSEYQRPGDIDLAAALLKLAPQEGLAFMGLKRATEREDGCIPPKYRELIAIAVGLTTQCAYCIDIHTRNAVKQGATREELAETVFITAALRAGAASGHGLLALRLFEEAEAASR